MNTGTENILQQFWGLSEIDQVPVEEIEARCAQYPYFAPLQLLLAQKYKQQQHAAYSNQAAKTSVYFNNWHWLNELLEGRVSVPSDKTSFVQDHIEAGAALNLPADTNEIIIADSLEVASATTSTDAPDTNPFPAEAVLDVEETASVFTEVNASEEVPAISETYIEETQADNVVIAQAEQPSAELNEDPVDFETFTEPVTYNAVIDNEVPAAIVEEPKQPALPIQEISTTSDDLIDPADEEDEPFIDHQKEPTALPGIAEIKQNINLLKNTLADLSTGSAPVIPIEPLHTIDYFASQGIKLKDLGIDPKDMLGQKLKSFTEWLKTMKKLHPEKLDTKIDEKAQSSIQNMAEHSNSTEDVLTESIAEVYARQGLKEKAREVYLKLSLQNPGKNAYFAAKISNLNEL